MKSIWFPDQPLQYHDALLAVWMGSRDSHDELTIGLLSSRHGERVCTLLVDIVKRETKSSEDPPFSGLNYFTEAE